VLEAPRETEPGRFVAQYTPPRVAEATEIEVTARAPKQDATALAKAKVEPVPFDAGALPGSGPLRIRGPARVLLGGTGAIEYEATSGDGAPLEFFASQGSIVVKDSSGGRTVATYRPPSSKFPEFAVLVVVSADGVLVDYAKVELWGSPVVTTTSEPRANVRFKLGDDEYGPFRADRRGKASARIRVPPAAPPVKALARDAFGNTNVAPIDVGLPEVRATGLACPSQSAELIFVALDTEGKLERDLELEVKSSVGSIRKAAASDAAFSRFPVVIPKDVPAGAPLVFSVVRPHVKMPLQCATEVPGEPPYDFDVKLSRPKFKAGEREPLVLLVSYHYHGTREPRAMPVQAEFSLGARAPGAEKSVALDPKTAEVLWLVPNVFEGKTVAEATLRLPLHPPVTKTIQVPLEAAPLERVEAQLEPGQSSRRRVLRVRGLDRYGNTVVSPIRWSVKSRGQIGPLKHAADHSWVATYRVTAARDEIELTADAGPSTRLDAEFDVGGVPLEVGARVGYLYNGARISAPMGMLHVGMPLPFIDPGLSVRLEGGAYMSRTTARAEPLPEPVKISIVAVPLVAAARYQYPLGDFQLLAGAGAGALELTATTKSESVGEVSESKLQFALLGNIGLGWLIGPGMATFDLGYLYSESTMTTARGSVGGPNALFGYTLGL
jgi:hypothetical protein